MGCGEIRGAGRAKLESCWDRGNVRSQSRPLCGSIGMSQLTCSIRSIDSHSDSERPSINFNARRSRGSTAASLMGDGPQISQSARVVMQGRVHDRYEVQQAEVSGAGAQNLGSSGASETMFEFPLGAFCVSTHSKSASFRRTRTIHGRKHRHAPRERRERPAADSYTGEVGERCGLGKCELPGG